MRKFLTILTLLLVAGVETQAQVVRIDSLSKWKKKLAMGLNINQASFSGNWKAGGINSFGVNALLGYKADYVTDKLSWTNEIDLLYGFVNNAGQGYRKSVDRIFLDSKYGRKINDKWSAFTSINFLSQFTKGYKYEKDALGAEQELLISDAFAPIFITSAWGAEYHPSSYFNLRISPFAPRVTIVSNAQRFVATVGPEPYGVKPDESARFEWLAFQMMADFNKDIATNVNLKWRYMLFANYETLDFKTIDHRLDLMLTVKAGKYVNMSLGGIILYDYDQDVDVQLNQVFSVGLAYSFRNYEEK